MQYEEAICLHSLIGMDLAGITLANGFVLRALLPKVIEWHPALMGSRGEPIVFLDPGDVEKVLRALPKKDVLCRAFPYPVLARVGETEFCFPIISATGYSDFIVQTRLPVMVGEEVDNFLAGHPQKSIEWAPLFTRCG